ncbi:er membrane protein [Apiospora aurea]|uniref:Er membrane protein n=1 Tax=Apiospora aurea TaxID=335848 RepID=A0ABR1QHE7_9PEZI
MASTQPTGSLLTLVTLLALVNMAMGASIPMTYCASINTASDSATSSIYQSDGLCRDQCTQAGTAFAIIQDKNCWCSDIQPARDVQVSTTKCNKKCSGYPDDTCGGDGLWGYMMLGKDPSGTQGANKPSPPQTTTAQNTVTLSPTTHDAPAPVFTTVTTKQAPSADPSPDPKTEEPLPKPSPSMLVSTVTKDGSVSVATVTVYPPPVSTSANTKETPEVDPGSSKGLSTGAAVGVAVGVIGFFVITGAIAAFFLLRRKRRAQNQALLDRQNSVRGSSAGMMSTPRTEMASTWDGDSMNRRNSRLMPHDPRMDPYATNIYGRFDNKSHESINTLRDDRDYSRRVLRTTNPDPTDGDHP